MSKNEYQGARIFAPPRINTTWDGECQRCGKETNSYTMSWFNTDLICMPCNDEENDHPDIDLAKDVEVAHVKVGNYNFPGIGFPGKDSRVTIDTTALYPTPIVEEE